MVWCLLGGGRKGYQKLPAAPPAPAVRVLSVLAMFPGQPWVHEDLTDELRGVFEVAPETVYRSDWATPDLLERSPDAQLDVRYAIGDRTFMLRLHCRDHELRTERCWKLPRRPPKCALKFARLVDDGDALMRDVAKWCREYEGPDGTWPSSARVTVADVFAGADVAGMELKLCYAGPDFDDTWASPRWSAPVGSWFTAWPHFACGCWACDRLLELRSPSWWLGPDALQRGSATLSGAIQQVLLLIPGAPAVDVTHRVRRVLDHAPGLIGEAVWAPLTDLLDADVDRAAQLDVRHQNVRNYRVRAHRAHVLDVKRVWFVYKGLEKASELAKATLVPRDPAGQEIDVTDLLRQYEGLEGNWPSSPLVTVADVLRDRDLSGVSGVRLEFADSQVATVPASAPLGSWFAAWPITAWL